MAPFYYGWGSTASTASTALRRQFTFYHSVPRNSWNLPEKLVNNGIVDHVENVAFFLISSMVLNLLSQLKIFS